MFVEFLHLAETFFAAVANVLLGVHFMISNQAEIIFVNIHVDLGWEG